MQISWWLSNDKHVALLGANHVQYSPLLDNRITIKPSGVIPHQCTSMHVARFTHLTKLLSRYQT